MSAVSVRQGTADDVPALAALRWAWSGEGHAPLSGSLEEYQRDLRAWYDTRDDFAAYVAVDEGDQVVGMAWLALVVRVPDPRAFHRRTGDVQSVYVLPEHRNGGVGARLVAALVEHARAAGCTRVTVHSDARAVPVYERAGFSVLDRLMVLDLTGRHG